MKQKILKVDYARVLDTRTWTSLSIGDGYTESIFMDSGAYGLFNIHVIKTGGEVMGKHGKVLDRRDGGFQAAKDYSWFDLTPGSDCRKYLARYANVIKKCPDNTETMFVNVDAIKNPDKSWEVHQFFLKEYGIWLKPVVHFGASLKHLHRYLDTGKCDLLGMGGLGHQTSIMSYMKWADSIYQVLCPASNGYKPTVRTHGFAMTSHKLICRYPWWSVDSATWVKLAAYGWLLVPRWNGQWRFDVPPLQINMSRRPLDVGRKTKFWWRKHTKSPRQTKNRHLDNSPKAAQELAIHWLDVLGIPLGSFDVDGNIVELGATSTGTALAQANLHYFKSLEESRPKWPYPLDKRVLNSNLTLQKGFGL